LKEALGEGRRADGPFPGVSFFAALLLAIAAGICRAEAVEAPPIRRFGEIVCEAIDLCGIWTGSSCPDGHVRSVCTATELHFVRAATVTVGCRWAETAADTTAAEVGPLRRTVLCCWMTICRAWGKGMFFSAFTLWTSFSRSHTGHSLEDAP